MSSEKMIKSLSTQCHVGCFTLFVCLGSQKAKPIEREIAQYIRKNGIEWTCNRLKSIWTAALHLQNGDLESAVQIYRKNSISYHKDTCIPKGQYGWLVRQFVKSRKPILQRKYAACLRFYTNLYIAGSPTKKQSEKAITSISSPYSGNIQKETLRTLGNIDFQKATDGMLGDIEKLKWATARYAQGNSVNSPFQPHSTSYYFTDVQLNQAHIRELRSQPYGQFILSLMTESWKPDGIPSSFKDEAVRQIQLEYGLDSGFSGRVLGMQQNGCKLRTAAQPTAAVQVSFLRLHALCDFVCDIVFPRESCFKNQEEAAYAARQHLVDGHNVYSVDLSSATDRFPRWYSEGILDSLNAQNYANALEQVCNRPWKAGNLRGRSKLYYEVGQPMGMYGSFPLFHLSNMVVAANAVRDARELASHIDGYNLIPFRDGSFFKVVGDDIVLSDEIVAQCYKHTMLELGVEISEPKSFSGRVAEIAGFVLLPGEKDRINVFRPYKHSLDSFVRNPLEFAHSVGNSVAKVNERWDNIFKSYRNSINHRTISLNPITYEEQYPSQSIAGRESWCHSLTEKVSKYLQLSDFPSRQLACCKEWCESQYDFANITFYDYVKSLISDPDTSHTFALGFDPEEEKKADKARKALAFRIPQEFWKDPLNSEYAYTNGIETKGIRAGKAKVRDDDSLCR